jgi:ATP-dependent 26S proteasome regulatory subunit
MEIGLPNEGGRREILRIHTHNMRAHQKLSDDVSIEVSVDS